MAVGATKLYSAMFADRSRPAPAQKGIAGNIYKAADVVRGKAMEVYQRASQAVKARVPTPQVPKEIKALASKVRKGIPNAIHKAEKSMLEAFKPLDRRADGAAAKLPSLPRWVAGWDPSAMTFGIALDECPELEREWMRVGISAGPQRSSAGMVELGTARLAETRRADNSTTDARASGSANASDGQRDASEEQSRLG